MMDRRKFLGWSAGAFALAMTESACNPFAEPGSKDDARIDAVPVTPHSDLLAPGTHPLGLGDGGRDGFVFVPQAAASGTVPLLLLLHGATGEAHNWDYLVPMLQSRGIAAVVPDSRQDSWDYRYGTFGPDVHFINIALAYAFDRIRVDASHVAVGGFSDGATYALTIGLNNGDLFHHIMAWSPSIPIRLKERGKPRIFIAHGTNDAVLPVEGTRDVTVPNLRNDGYDVTYEEFPGGHVMPNGTASDAFSWWLAAG